MPKKKSPKISTTALTAEFVEAFRFMRDVAKHLPESSVLAAEMLVICCHRAVEKFVFDMFLATVNRDASQFARSEPGVKFPRNLNLATCEFLLLGGDSYFDLRNSESLRKFSSKTLPATHPFNKRALAAPEVRAAVDRICALRNLDAHRSETAKARAKKVLKVKRLGTAGEFLLSNRRRQRFREDLTLVAAHFLAAFEGHHEIGLLDELEKSS